MSFSFYLSVFGLYSDSIIIASIQRAILLWARLCVCLLHCGYFIYSLFLITIDCSWFTVSLSLTGHCTCITHFESIVVDIHTSTAVCTAHVLIWFAANWKQRDSFNFGFIREHPLMCVLNGSSSQMPNSQTKWLLTFASSRVSHHTSTLCV